MRSLENKSKRSGHQPIFDVNGMNKTKLILLILTPLLCGMVDAKLDLAHAGCDARYHYKEAQFVDMSVYRHDGMRIFVLFEAGKVTTVIYQSVWYAPGETNYLLHQNRSSRWNITQRNGSTIHYSSFSTKAVYLETEKNGNLLIVTSGLKDPEEYSSVVNRYTPTARDQKYRNRNR